MSPEILDAKWVPANDADLIRRRRELDAAFDHAVRRERAYDYLNRVEKRVRDQALRRVLGALAFFLWAMLLALLVGAV